MNSKLLIVAVVLSLLVCFPLNRPAAALDRDKDPEQLWNIGEELSQVYINHPDKSRVRDSRNARLRDRERVYAILQQNNLLQELLSTSETYYDSTRITDEAKIEH